MKQNRGTRVGLGAASLIMILLVLCLVLMGVLSLMSARADLSLSRRHAELAEGYAKASASAQQALSQLDALLVEARDAAQSDAQYAGHRTEIEAIGETSIEWLDEKNARMQFDAGEERLIEVCIACKSWDEARDARYEITSYRLVDMKEWDQTESLILMDM